LDRGSGECCWKDGLLDVSVVLEVVYGIVSEEGEHVFGTVHAPCRGFSF